MRTWLIERLEKKARQLPMLVNLSVKKYNLSRDECAEMMRRGIVFDVDRMGKKCIHFSHDKKAQELRDKVTAHRKAEQTGE